MIKIVISGPNCTEGGILNIMKDLLVELISYNKFNITALVHSKLLFMEEELINNVKFLEFKDSKSSWFKRLNYEYKEFYNLSLELSPDIWISMHDITPNVKTNFLATYCHNATPFYKFNISDFLYDKKFGLFTLFYKYLYKINITKNDFIFVQQHWIKNEFERMFGINNIIVTKPNKNQLLSKINKNEKDIEFKFFYPSFPRVFKNFEIICKAVEYLINEFKYRNFSVYLTIDGTENKYAYNIYKKYKNINNIKFIGLLPRKEVFNYYEIANVLIFPSKLETWGLPISEFMNYDKPIIVSNLQYAKETLQNYRKVNFFNTEDYIQLAKLMKSHLDDTVLFDDNTYDDLSSLRGWREFVEFIHIKYMEKK